MVRNILKLRENIMDIGRYYFLSIKAKNYRCQEEKSLPHISERQIYHDKLWKTSSQIKKFQKFPLPSADWKNSIFFPPWCEQLFLLIQSDMSKFMSDTSKLITSAEVAESINLGRLLDIFRSLQKRLECLSIGIILGGCVFFKKK